MAGRPRTPTKVLKLRGAFKKNPQRGREREGEPESVGPLGDPPDQFDEAHRARWAEISGWCSWLGDADRPTVEAVCVLWMKVRNNQAKSADFGLLIQYLSKLGMTPTDRSRVKVPQAAPKKNAFQELA